MDTDVRVALLINVDCATSVGFLHFISSRRSLFPQKCAEEKRIDNSSFVTLRPNELGVPAPDSLIEFGHLVSWEARLSLIIIIEALGRCGNPIARLRPRSSKVTSLIKSFLLPQPFRLGQG